MLNYFSEEYLEKLRTLKSETFQDRFCTKLEEVDKYMREDEYEEVYSFIEERVPIVEKGNMISDHSFGTFTIAAYDDAKQFLEELISEINSWFMMNDIQLLQCRCFLLCLHVDDYEFTDEELDLFIDTIMMNFVLMGVPCPDVEIIPDTMNRKELNNGFYVLALR